MNHEYDNQGRETAYTYSDMGRFEKNYDAAGRKISEKLPSGLTHGYEYNAGNNLVRQSDSRGTSARAEYDASGALTRIVEDGGAWIQIVRDQAGRIAQLNNSRGQSRNYIYDSRGALTGFAGADGRRLAFQYNRRGELQSVINAQSASLIYDRDQRGKLVNLQPLTASNKNFWQFQKVNYVKALTNLPGDSDCAFGDGFEFPDRSGWMDSWGGSGSIFAESPTGGSCYDPFGGMGGGGTGENCQQCRNRQHNICASQAGACAGVGVVSSAALLGCLGLAAPPAQVTCAVIGGILIAAGTIISCGLGYSACEMSILDKCPQCN